MMSAMFKAFAGRAGWLPSLLALAIIALIGFTTVAALPRIEQNIEKQVSQYLEANLSKSDSLVGLQVHGRDVLLSGRIADPETVQAGLMSLPGVRRVVISDAGSMASSRAGGASDGDASPVTSQVATFRSSVESDVSAPASIVKSEISEPSPNSHEPDKNIANTVSQNAATSTGQSSISDDLSSVVSDARAERTITASRANPEALILSLNKLSSVSVMFAPGDARISAETGSSLMPLAQMMSQNPDLLLGIEGYPDFSVASDEGAFIGFVRARNAEKFLLEQQVESSRIFTRYVSTDGTSAEEGVQLKFYILK